MSARASRPLPVQCTRHTVGGTKERTEFNVPWQHREAVPVWRRLLLAALTVVMLADSDGACSTTPNPDGLVIILPGPTEIGTNAFRNCVALRNMVFVNPPSITAIRSQAFQK